MTQSKIRRYNQRKAAESLHRMPAEAKALVECFEQIAGCRWMNTGLPQAAAPNDRPKYDRAKDPNKNGQRFSSNGHSNSGDKK